MSEQLNQRRSIVELGAAVVMSAQNMMLGAVLHEEANADNINSYAEADIENPQLSVPMGILTVASIVTARQSGRHSR